VRTWNLFHGNAHPPERRAFLRQMIELVTSDRPDVVCLQELPVWALRHLERWSGMHANGAVARRPLLPFAARAVTAVHHGLLRSAVTGEADAILTRDPARALGVHIVGERKLRRIAQVVDLDGVTIVNALSSIVSSRSRGNARSSRATRTSSPPERTGSRSRSRGASTRSWCAG
jgi:endonuclease/exonuclease/phosphatase family metal-dependent hydrolase